MNGAELAVTVTELENGLCHKQQNQTTTSLATETVTLLLEFNPLLIGKLAWHIH